MIFAHLIKVGDWVARHPAVQWVLGVLAFLAALILWGERREGQGRRREKVQARERDLVLRERATETHIAIVEEERSDADRAIYAGERALRSESRALERMSDQEWRLTFGRDREAGDPGYRSKG